MANISYTTAVPRVGRRIRAPKHPFSLLTRPWQIQPFLIAPVIPGETMKNLLIQSRVVTDPIKSKLVGWWNEYYIFYVKHRDLNGREDFTEMMLDLDKDMASYNAAASAPYHHFGNAINWAQLCLERVVETYFREEGETWDLVTIDGMPAGAVNVENYIDSALLSDAYLAPDVVLADGDEDVVVTASEIDNAMRTWQFMRANQMTEMSYEDWLATYGISTPAVELHRPELLRYIREWQYPSNTVDPEDGGVASAVSWAIRDRADKDRFFAEPGFIFGVTICRPKAYLSTDGSAVDLMQDALSWLPAIMRDDPYSSLKLVPHDHGPLATAVTDTDGYWVDIKDLLLYGDQFVNYARDAASYTADPHGVFVDLPTTDLANKNYPDLDDSKALFGDASADNKTRVRQDGIVTLSILGAQVDTTPPASMGS